MLLLTNLSVACTSWRVQSVSPEQFITKQRPRSVQIRERGGHVYELLWPRLQGDSLTGNVRFSKRRGLEGLGALVTLDCLGGKCNMNMGMSMGGWGGSWSNTP